MKKFNFKNNKNVCGIYCIKNNKDKKDIMVKA